MPLIDLADTEPQIVTSEVDQDVAARLAVHHVEGNVAVVDPDGRFVGLVPPKRLLHVLLREHDEDMARIGGYLKQSSLARNAAEEPVSRPFAHRGAVAAQPLGPRSAFGSVPVATIVQDLVSNAIYLGIATALV